MISPGNRIPSRLTPSNFANYLKCHKTFSSFIQDQVESEREKLRRDFDEKSDGTKAQLLNSLSDLKINLACLILISCLSKVGLVIFFENSPN